MEVELSQVTKECRRRVVLEDINLQLNGPKLYCLYGRRGAGKTSLLELMAGQALPTVGEVKVNGHRPFDYRPVLKDICLIKEKGIFPEAFKVKDVLQTYARFYPNWDTDFAEELLTTYHLPSHSRIKDLSFALEALLGIVVGLASGAKLTLFDDVFSVIDSRSRKRFTDDLIDLAEKQERIILLATDALEGIDFLFEEFFVLNEGRLVLAENMERVREKAYAIFGPAEQVEAYMEGRVVLHTKRLSHERIAYFYDEPGDVPSNVRFDPLPLEDLFFYLTEAKEEAGCRI